MLPDDRIALLSGLNVYEGGSTLLTNGWIFDTGTCAASEELSFMNSGWALSTYKPGVLLLPDGMLLMAGGFGLPEGTTYCINCVYEGVGRAVLLQPQGGNGYRLPDMNQIRGNCQPILLLDGRVLMVGDAALELFDPKTQIFKLLSTFDTNGMRGQLMPDGKVLLSATRGMYPDDSVQLGVWDPATGQVTWQEAPSQFTLGAAIPLPDGRLLTGSWRSVNALLDPATSLFSTHAGYQACEELREDPLLEPLPSGKVLVMDHEGSTWPKPVLAKVFDPQSPLVVTPFRATQNLGLPVQFAASGTESASGVTWTCNAGTITPDGLFTATQMGLYRVTATSASGKAAHAWLRVVPPISVKIPGYPDNVFSGCGQYHVGMAWKLKARVLEHSDDSVAWSVQEGDEAGTITADGVLTALRPGTLHVVAVSAVDPSKSASFEVTALPVLSSPSILPASQVLYVGEKARFDLVEPSGDGRAFWGVDGGTLAGSGCSGSAFYTAPLEPGTYTLVAWHALDASKQVQATITVIPIQGVRVFPERVVLAPGGQTTFKAYVQLSRGLQEAVPENTLWTASAGHLVKAGEYVAPTEPGTYTVQAVVSGQQSNVAEIIVTSGSGYLTANAPVFPRSYSHAMTRLLDGNILITGGVFSYGSCLDSAEIYDPRTRSFTAVATPMGAQRAGHSATLLPSGQVLLVGGTQKADALEAELYDPLTRTFRPTSGQSAFQHGAGHRAFLLPSGKVLLLGASSRLFSGVDGRIAEIYDPVTERFSWQGMLTAPASEGRSGVVMPDGRLLVAGGRWQGACSALSETFDFKTGSFMPSGLLTVGRSTTTLIPMGDGKILAAGGSSDSSTNAKTTEFYDPQSGSFSPGAGLYAEARNAVELVDGSIWLMTDNRLEQRLFPWSGVRADIFGYRQQGDPRVLLATGDVLTIGAYLDASGPHGRAELDVVETKADLSIRPRELTLVPGQSWPFMASASGMGYPELEWFVQEGASGGSVTSSGVYTAPWIAGTYHVVARSTGNGGLLALATVHVPDFRSVSLSASFIKVAPGGSQRFSAQVLGLEDQGVTWAANGGSISEDGVFNAPAEAGICQVTATSTANPSLSATATVVVASGGGTLPSPLIQGLRSDKPVVQAGETCVISWEVQGAYQLTLMDVASGESFDVTGRRSWSVSPAETRVYRLTAVNTSGTATQELTLYVSPTPVSLAIDPTGGFLYAGETAQFGYALLAPTNRVTWSASAGSISTGGLFQAPPKAGLVTVKVTSVDYPTLSASATMQVLPITLELVPRSAKLDLGMPMLFGYSFGGPAGHPLSWSASGGTITQNGAYTAPATAGTYTVTLSCPDLNVSVSATVVVDAQKVQVMPTFAATAPGGTLQFQAISSSGGVSWSVAEANGGTISQTGLYTAPAVVGDYTVIATAQGGSSIASARVAVRTGAGTGGGITPGLPATGEPGASGARVVMTPGELQIDAGMFYAFSATVTGADDPGVTWALKDAPTEATIDEKGVFNASRKGEYFVVATSIADPSAKVEGRILVASALHADGNTPLAQFEDYSVTLLKDGKILIAGGLALGADYNSDQYAFSGKAWVFDPDTGAYTPTGDMLTPRAFHHAVLLDDGRVLMAGGMANWLDPWRRGRYKGSVIGDYYPLAEVYDPASGSFQPLPEATHRRTSYIDENIPDFTAPGMMDDDHAFGSTFLKLKDGRVWVFGGRSGWFWRLFSTGTHYSYPEGGEIFDPSTGLFRLANGMADGGQWVNSKNHAVALLPDGKVVKAGGFVGFGGTFDASGAGEASPSNSGAVWNPLTNVAENTFTLNVGRIDHTMTTLADGRVLIVGGATNPHTWLGQWADASTYELMDQGFYEFSDTATAEIYDPVTNTTKLLASGLHQARRRHAALLLPTGQVLIVGGVKCTGTGSNTAQYAYPNYLEVFDPDTETFSVMDKLDYGLSEPKLALLQDGSVFLAGQVQAPMDPPATTSQTQGLRMMMAASPSGATLTAGSAMMGTISAGGWAVADPFVDQGVEIAGKVNGTTFAPKSTETWKNVPLIVDRPALTKLTVWCGNTWDKEIPVKIEIPGDSSFAAINTVAKPEKKTLGIYRQSNKFLIDAFIIPQANVKANLTLKLTLQPPGIAPEELSLTIPFQVAPPLNVDLVPVDYVYKDASGARQQYTLSDAELNTFKASLESTLKELYPASLGQISVTVQPFRATWSEDGKDLSGADLWRSPYEAPPDPGQPDLRIVFSGLLDSSADARTKKWTYLQTYFFQQITIQNARYSVAFPKNRYVVGVVPMIAGTTIPSTPGTAYTAGGGVTPNEARTDGSHFAVVMNQSSLDAAHEIGHVHGRKHAPYGGVERPDPSWPTAVRLSVCLDGV